MSHQSYREESRRNWGRDSERSAITDDDIKLGAILRIADAAEVMAKRYTELIAERDHFADCHKRALDRERTLERRLISAKGQITKLKKRLAIAQTQAFGADPATVAFAIKKAR